MYCFTFTVSVSFLHLDDQCYEKDRNFLNLVSSCEPSLFKLWSCPLFNKHEIVEPDVWIDPSKTDGNIVRHQAWDNFTNRCVTNIEQSLISTTRNIIFNGKCNKLQKPWYYEIIISIRISRKRELFTLNSF